MDTEITVAETIGLISALISIGEFLRRLVQERAKITPPAKSGDVTVALTGVSARCEAGQMTPSIEVALR